MASFDQHQNFAASLVATAPSPATSGTSLVVTASDGSKFPTPPFNATVWAAGAQPTTANAEIVRVTGRSTDTLTIVRAQESSSARTVVIGDQIAATITAKTLTDVETGLNVTSTGAFGSEPGSPNAGDLYLPNNGVVVERYSGSLWVPWGPLWSLTAPPAVSTITTTTFGWINQGSATASATNGGLNLRLDAGGSISLSCLFQTAPVSTPWTRTAIILPCWPDDGAHSCGVGLAFRASGSGAIHTYGPWYNTNAIYSSKFSSATAFSAHYTNSGSVVSHLMPTGPLFLRVADDGSSRVCSYSHDGFNFFVSHTIGRTDFLTADQVGIFVMQNTTSSSTGAIGNFLLSWA